VKNRRKKIKLGEKNWEEKRVAGKRAFSVNSRRNALSITAFRHVPFPLSVK